MHCLNFVNIFKLKIPITLYMQHYKTHPNMVSTIRTAPSTMSTVELYKLATLILIVLFDILLLLNSTVYYMLILIYKHNLV